MAFRMKAFLKYKLHWTLNIRLEVFILIPGFILTLAITTFGYYIDSSQQLSESQMVKTKSHNQIQSKQVSQVHLGDARYKFVLRFCFGLLITMSIYLIAQIYLQKIIDQLREINSDLASNLDQTCVQILGLQTYTERLGDVSINNQNIQSKIGDCLSAYQAAIRRLGVGFESAYNQLTEVKNNEEINALEFERISREIKSNWENLKPLFEISKNSQSHMVQSVNAFEQLPTSMQELKDSVFQTKVLATHALGQAQLPSFSKDGFVYFVEKIGVMLSRQEQMMTQINALYSDGFSELKKIIEGKEQINGESENQLNVALLDYEAHLLSVTGALESFHLLNQSSAQSEIDLKTLFSEHESINQMSVNLENSLSEFLQDGKEVGIQHLNLNQALLALKESMDVVLRDQQALDIIVEGETPKSSDRIRPGDFDV
jgi:hypothetical protein